MGSKQLKEISIELAEKITNATEGVSYFENPYKHIVIDGVFEEDFSKELIKSFPDLNDSSWDHSNDEGIEIKSRSNWQSEFDIPEGIYPAIKIFNSRYILDAMSKKLNIPKLIPDPYFTGGGLNVTEKGGLLDVHIDGNYHDATGLNRRVNLLLYLNQGWQKEFGGEFGLYNEDGEKLIKSIPPLFNRCVIFDTHDKSFHGLPNPVNFPKNNPRRSIILYYYTVATRPKGQNVIREPHSALWKSKNITDKKGKKTRDFS